MTEDDSGLFDDSRRSFMKKGAAATTALALGASATAGTVSAQEDGGVVLVYGDDYEPGTNFEVISSLNTQTKEDLIADSGAEDDVFDDPDDWDAYIISYDTGSDAPDWGFLLTEEVDLSAGDSDTMGEDGEFREPSVDLIEATPGETADGGNGDGMDGGDENGAAADGGDDGNQTEATADGGDGGDGGNQTGGGGGGN